MSPYATSVAVYPALFRITFRVLLFLWIGCTYVAFLVTKTIAMIPRNRVHSMNAYPI